LKSLNSHQKRRYPSRDQKSTGPCGLRKEWGGIRGGVSITGSPSFRKHHSKKTCQTSHEEGRNSGCKKGKPGRKPKDRGTHLGKGKGGGYTKEKGKGTPRPAGGGKNIYLCTGGGGRGYQDGRRSHAPGVQSARPSKNPREQNEWQEGPSEFVRNQKGGHGKEKQKLIRKGEPEQKKNQTTPYL